MATSRPQLAQSFQFNVTIPGIDTSFGFISVSGLTGEVASREYLRCNDLDGPLKLPGRRTHTPVNLSHGITFDAGISDLINWFDQVTLANRGTTYSLSEVKKNVEIDTQLTSLEPYTKIKLIDAWPTKLEHSGLDASKAGIIIQSLTLVFHDIEWSVG
jgi:phage tail-like protein